jgi:hypothetical protein
LSIEALNKDPFYIFQRHPIYIEKYRIIKAIMAKKDKKPNNSDPLVWVVPISDVPKLKKKKIHPLAWIIPLSVVGGWLVINIALLILQTIVKNNQKAKNKNILALNPWNEWMYYLPDRNIAVRDLVLPGSHDCGSYQMTFKNPQLIQESFSGVVPYVWVAGGVIKDWSINHYGTLFQQCMTGIRVFDVRCSQAEDGSWWIWHGFRTVSLENALAQFYTFIVQNPSELLVLWVRIDSTMTSEVIFDSYFQPYKGIMVDHSVMSASSSVADIVDTGGKNWLVYAGSGMNNFSNFYGDYSLMVGDWFNITNVNQTITDLTQELATRPNKDTTENLFVQQYIITPQVSDFVWGELSRIFLWGMMQTIHLILIFDLGWKYDLFWKNQVLLNQLPKYVTTNNNAIKQKVFAIWGDHFENSDIRTYIAQWNNLQFLSTSSSSL